MHCSRRTILPNAYEGTRVVCGCNNTRKKNKLSKISKRKIKLINKLKIAEEKIMKICIIVSKIYQCDDNENCLNV